MDNEIAAIHETSKMTDQSEKSKISGLGARLRKTRESMHLTQKEAAARLYLNPKIVEIIENEAFFDGPPMTFMRGYLRSYARILNFPDSEIKAAIDELELNTTPTALATPSLQASPMYRGDRYIRWITYLIVLTLISLVVLWWSSHSKYVIADVPSTNQVPSTTTTAITNTVTTDIKATETLPTVSTENTTMAAPTPTEPKTEALKLAPAVPAVKTEPTTTATEPVAATPTAPQSIPTLAETPPPVTTSTEPSSSLMTPSSNTGTTAVPNGENPANAMLNTEPKEKTVTKHPKKKYKRHQYRPIENMDIPEPD